MLPTLQVKKLLRQGTGDLDVDLVRSAWPEQLELEAKYTNKALADEVRPPAVPALGTNVPRPARPRSRAVAGQAQEARCAGHSRHAPAAQGDPGHGSQPGQPGSVLQGGARILCSAPQHAGRPTQAHACLAPQLEPNWGPKGLDWSNRAEVMDLYSAYARTVPDQAKHAALRGILQISEEEASKLESLGQQAAQPAHAGGADEAFF